MPNISDMGKLHALTFHLILVRQCSKELEEQGAWLKKPLQKTKVLQSLLFRKHKGVAHVGLVWKNGSGACIRVRIVPHEVLYSNKDSFRSQKLPLQFLRVPSCDKVS